MMYLKQLVKARWVGLGLLLVATAVVYPARQASLPTPTPDEAAFFESNIRPLLVAKCYPCHGATTQLGGLRLDSPTAILKGGDSGPALVPKDPDKSLLITAVLQTGKLKMPQGGKLTAKEIADLSAWIKMGAPWPMAAVKGDDKSRLWSLLPVTTPPIPKVKNGVEVKNPIDNFVLSKLGAKGLNYAPPADRRTLIRRVTFDLIGLPPTAAEVDAFVADKSPNAYEKVVDRLLASPQYGERSARAWLDVARYADTKGYVFIEDRNYPNAYTYRNWVIDAFNRDLPYDQFIVRQLAADRLPDVQQSDDKRDLAALGFLTVGRRFLNSQQDIIDDRIDVTMRGFQGFTVACARCHDHKFDPIPTQDYYSLYAVFDSSQEVSAPIGDKAVREPWVEFNEKVANNSGASRNLVQAQISRLRKLNVTPEEGKPLSAEVRTILQNLREGADPASPDLDKLNKSFEPAARDELAELQSKLTQLQAASPKKPEFAMAMQDSPNPHDIYVFKRGNPANAGDPAPRRFLLALSKPSTERPLWKDSGRLELAQSIASKENPLTARVFVNRVWQGHFGTGIVRTASDFGHQGDPPSHPELLDWLAGYFMENGWSVKKLHRLIVTSAAYRQSSSVSAAALNADPDNRLISRMNRKRLDLEQMRDEFMDVAGKLDDKQVGGKSVDIWSQPFTARRALYGFIERQNLPGIFRTFDFASPDTTNARRFVTTVPQQALFFMNSPFSVEQATAVANRSEITSSADNAQRVRRLYRLLFDRMPDASEVAAGQSYLGADANAIVDRPIGPWRYGYGGIDPLDQRIKNFVPFAVFKDGNYRVGDQFPDPTLGYLTLGVSGLHPGHDAEHAVIRRWIAPANLTIQIEGTLTHSQAQGDGVRGRVVSSRSGTLGDWDVHNGEAKTSVAAFQVTRGDTIDFMVDPKSSDAYDAFTWAPIIRTSDGSQSWNSAADFAPPPGPGLSRLTLYVQALMMTNEFMFID